MRSNLTAKIAGATDAPPDHPLSRVIERDNAERLVRIAGALDYQAVGAAGSRDCCVVCAMPTRLGSCICPACLRLAAAALRAQAKAMENGVTR